MPDAGFEIWPHPYQVGPWAPRTMANGVPCCVYMSGKSAGIRRRSGPLVSAADVIARWTCSGRRCPYVPDGDESHSDDSGTRRPECAPYKQEGACPHTLGRLTCRCSQRPGTRPRISAWMPSTAPVSASAITTNSAPSTIAPKAAPTAHPLNATLRRLAQCGRGSGRPNLRSKGRWSLGG